VITTERLLLTPLTRDIARQVASGERSGAWAEDYPTEGDLVIAGLLLADPTGAEPGPWGSYQVVERGTGLAVGGVGFKGPPRDGAVEVGYGLAPSARGRGLATEAVRALVELALADPEVAVVEAEVQAGNHASERVLLRAGFTPAGAEAGAAWFRRGR